MLVFYCLAWPCPVHCLRANPHTCQQVQPSCAQHDQYLALTQLLTSRSYGPTGEFLKFSHRPTPRPRSHVCQWVLGSYLGIVCPLVSAFVSAIGCYGPACPNSWVCLWALQSRQAWPVPNSSTYAQLDTAHPLFQYSLAGSVAQLCCVGPHPSFSVCQWVMVNVNQPSSGLPHGWVHWSDPERSFEFSP